MFSPSGNLRVFVHPRRLDPKQREFIDVFITKDPRVAVVQNRKDADYIVMDSRDLIDIRPKDRFIAIELADTYRMMFPLNHAGKRTRDRLKRFDARAVFLRQDSNLIWRNREILYNDNMVFLSIPLFLNGSVVNRDYQIKDDSALLGRNISANPKEYLYDWCWIGNLSSWDRLELSRKHLIPLLNDAVWTNWSGREITYPPPELTPSKRAIAIWTRKVKGKEWNARKNATIHFDEFMRLHRASKVCIGSNGNTMFCNKDAEMFSRNCFLLRHTSPLIDLNPLTPKDGAHWVLFDLDDFRGKLEYYVRHDDERERINDAGHEYFKWGYNGGWAKVYVDGLIEYLKTDDKRVFGDLLTNP